MLQQTRVDTVIPYFGRFLAQFPTIEALAAAGEGDVLALWSGLGYYRRARLLHKGVREAVAQYGAVPSDPESRRALPGVGRYTAGAIGSIAFGFEEPLVDGNVARVLSRVFALYAPLGSRESEKALWAHAEELVRGERPGDFNQALMELGATVCVPGRPRCETCPVAASCEALRTGRVNELPVVLPKAKPKPVSLVAVFVQNGAGEVLFTQHEGALFGGLWSLPMREGEGRSDAKGLLDEHDPHGVLADDEPVTRLVHVLSHRRLSIALYRARSAKKSHEKGRFVAPDARHSLGRSSLTEKLLAAADPAQLPLFERTPQSAKPKKSAKQSSPKQRTRKSVNE